MRKHVAESVKPKSKVFSLKKVTVISIIFVMIMGMMGVIATNDKVKSILISLSSGYEMTVVTTSTSVAQILAENNIKVLAGEVVTPDLNSDIDENRLITITKEEVEEEETEPEDYFSEEEILQSYSQIIEKIVTVQETIPFETITKDTSGGSSATTSKVVTAGVDGIKEVTYKITYRNGEEIEKTVISEEVIKEKVDKVVEVSTLVTSRGSSERAVTGTKAEYQAYAEQKCYAYGWSTEDFNNLVKLWNKESGWRVTAGNKYSGAYGIPQALPASKMASYGSDYLTNYKTQINWGLNYIKCRYGNPSNAWYHSVKYNWY